MGYYNQNNYPKAPYPSSGNKNATVKTSGCGPTSISMVVEGLAGVTFPPPQSAAFSISTGARASGGTDMVKLSQGVAEKFGLKVKQTKSIDEVLSAMRYNGAMAIANAAGGAKGLFSDGGHFICIDRVQGPYLVVWDPGLYAGKYDKPWRKNKVTVHGNEVYVSPESLDADIRKDYAAYFIFTKAADSVTGLVASVGRKLGLASADYWVKVLKGAETVSAANIASLFRKVCTTAKKTVTEANLYAATDSVLDLGADDYWRDVLAGKRTASAANMTALFGKIDKRV